MPIDVILVLGQSNATGYQLDRSADPIDKVLAWDGTTLANYRPNTFTGLEAAQPTGSWAGDLVYALRYRVAYPDKPLVVLRYTAAGTALAITTDADWNTQSRGELLDGARSYVRSAFAALRAKGYEPRIRIVWWQHGERDRGHDIASPYIVNLIAFIAALRDTSGGIAVPTSTPIVIGRLSSMHLDGVARSIRAAQTAVAAADVGGPQVLLDTDDLPMEDGLHFSRGAQVAIGDRLWAVDQGKYVEP